MIYHITQAREICSGQLGNNHSYHRSILPRWALMTATKPCWWYSHSPRCLSSNSNGFYIKVVHQDFQDFPMILHLGFIRRGTDSIGPKAMSSLWTRWWNQHFFLFRWKQHGINMIAFIAQIRMGLLFFYHPHDHHHIYRVSSALSSLWWSSSSSNQEGAGMRHAMMTGPDMMRKHKIVFSVRAIEMMRMWRWRFWWWEYLGNWNWSCRKWF